MKVLQINSFFTVGGPPRIVNGIYDTLIEEGHECKIAAAREKMYKPKDSIRIGTNQSVNMNVLKARMFDNEGFNAKNATRKLIDWIKGYNPDVIHLHNLHGYYINIELLFEYLKATGKPVIWTLHDCWAFTGHSAYCDAADCDRWKNGCYKCPQIREYPKAYVDQSKVNWEKKRKILCGVKNMTIVIPSNWLATLVKESFLQDYPVKVIHNGIDLTQFKPLENNFRKEYGLEGKYIVLGVASVWSDFKGLSDYIELSGMLDDEYKIVLVGLSDKQINDLPKNILGLPRTRNTKELACIYSCADVFLNLTYCDTFPTVNIEAIACSTPVVTYRTGGSAEVINELNGYVVEKGDVQGVKKILAQTKEKEWNRVEISLQASVYERLASTNKYISVYGKNMLMGVECEVGGSINKLTSVVKLNHTSLEEVWAA